MLASSRQSFVKRLCDFIMFSSVVARRFISRVKELCFVIDDKRLFVSFSPLCCKYSINMPTAELCLVSN